MCNRILSVTVGSTGARNGAGLKAQKFNLDLSGCDLLAGPNGVGKTTRGPLAITAAIEGLASVPTDPRRPYVGELPRNTAVTVRVETGAGVYDLTRDLGAARGKGVDESNKRAKDLIGLPPTAWDLSDFAAGTDGDRGKILDAVARAGGAIERWDAARAQSHVRELLTVDEQDVSALDACAKVLDSAPDGTTWLRSALVWAEDEQKRTNTAQKDAESYLGEITAATPSAPGGSAEEDQQAHQSAILRLADLDRGVRDVESRRAARSRHLAEGERLRAALVSTTAEGKRLSTPIPAPDVEIPASVRERVAAAERAATEPTGTDARDRRAALVAADAAIVTARAAVDAHDPVLRRATIEVAKATADADALRSLSGSDAVCVHCRAPDPLGVRQRVDAADAAATAAGLRLGTIRAAHDALTTAHATAQQTARSAADALRAVESGRPSDLVAARAELDRETRRAAAATETHRSAEAQRLADLTAARSRWVAARDAVAAWEALEVPADPEAPSTSDRESLAAEVRATDARLNTRREHAAHIARIEAASLKYQAAKAKWDATRALIVALRQARDDVAAAAYAPIDRAARELIVGAPGLPVPYFSGPSDYGAIVRGNRVAYAGLSESEQRITAAAIVYALATVAGCPCRLVLLDGLEVVQSNHRWPLIAALARAQRAGKIDNVVLTMATAPGEEIPAIEGVTLHLIEREEDTDPAPAPAQTSVTPAAEVEGACPF